MSSPTTFSKGMEALVNWSFSPTADVRMVKLAAKRMSETRPSVLYGDLLACDSFDVMEGAASIRLPTLVICGADDRMTPLRYSQFLAGVIPNARLEVVPQAGHMVMLEQPQAVAAALAAFLPGVPYYPGGG
jgi:pimeloyl-ACP methyl ester carboxylesterase